MGFVALFIPILALSIPIVAIITFGRRRGGVQSPEQQRRIELLEEKVRRLEQALDSVNGDVRELEDKNRFLVRLLEDKQA